LGANAASSIRFASNGTIYVAPVATAAPTDVETALAATWKPLGYVDPAGVEMTPTVETSPVEAWQSAVPVTYLVTSASFTMKFILQQFDKESVELYFGASFVAVPEETGVYQLDLSSSPALAETAMVIEWSDATVKNRLVVPRASVSARDGLQLVRTSNQKLGVTMSALDSSGKLGWILTNAAVGA